MYFFFSKLKNGVHNINLFNIEAILIHNLYVTCNLEVMSTGIICLFFYHYPLLKNFFSKMLSCGRVRIIETEYSINYLNCHPHFACLTHTISVYSGGMVEL